MTPRRRNAASSASVAVVLPAPECGAAMMSPRALIFMPAASPKHPMPSLSSAPVMTMAAAGTKGWHMERQERPLRRGWTTGTCATAAAKAAFSALVSGEFLDPVEVTLPRGERPSFVLALTRKEGYSATAGVIKDAGDDPDVTHGALVLATVRAGVSGAGVTFRAGEGVGTVTRPGLPLPPGEPAINPVPRRMIRDAIAEVAAAAGCPADAEVEIAIPGGAELAAKTLNGRLG